MRSSRAVYLAPDVAQSTLPPGPRAPVALQTLGWLARPTPFSERLRARYGDTFTIRIAGEGTWVMVSDPGAVKQVFTADPKVLHTGNEVLLPLLGPASLLLLQESEHLAERRRLLPPFHGERVQAYGELIGDIAAREVATWPAGEAIAIRPRMQALTLRVIMRAVLGSDDERLRSAIARMLAPTRDTRWAVITIGAGYERARRLFRRLRGPVERMLDEEIARRRRAPDLAERDDVLSLLLSGSELSGEQLRDELITLLFAGHETTATALAWALERLAHHPAAWARLREREEDYLDAVVKETLRLRPVVPLVLRRVGAPIEIGGWTLPAGVSVAPNILLLHRRPDLYPDPAAFRPERFLERPAGTYTWIPFGGGVRRCLGASLALFEMKVVLRAIAERVERLAPERAGAEASTRAAIVTLVPARGGRVVIPA
jgi:cytochrome P450